jgi:hypothetical protein
MKSDPRGLLASTEASDAPAARRLGGNTLELVTILAVMALATNAVLIQTVVTDPASPLKSVVRVGVLTLAVFAIAAGRTQVPRWMVGVVIYSAALFLLRDNSDQLSYVFVFALVPLLWSVPERRMVRALTWASIFSLLLIFSFLQAGITHNVTLAYRERATFGTHGVPFFFNVVYGAAAMAILYTFKYRSRWRFLVLGGCLVIATYLFRQTDARGGYYSLVLFVVLLGIVPLAARWRLFRAGIALLPIIFFAVSFVIASLWRSARYEKLLSYRPWLLHSFLDNVSLADFVLSRTVKRFDEFVTQVRTVDNSYLHLLVGGGVLLAVVYTMAFASGVRHLLEQRQYVDVAFLVASSVYFSSESIMLRIENVFVVYAWYLVLRNCRWSRENIAGTQAIDAMSSSTQQNLRATAISSSRQLAPRAYRGSRA